MFLGHFGLGFGSKAAAPRESLGVLFFAAQFVDLLWPVLLLIGWEHVRIEPGITRVTPLDFVHYPISHSLLMSVFWALIIGAIYYAVRRRMRGAVVVAVLVVSHWFLDLVVHRPDLPLLPGGEWKLGLHLWSSLVGTIVVELAIFFVGVFLYVRRTEAMDRIGSVGLWGLVVFLLVIYGGNLFGPPPPSEAAIAWTGHAQWLLILFAWWVDRHRRLWDPVK